MTTTKKPQDRLVKAEATETDEYNLTFEFEGRNVIAYGDNITGETMDYLSQGHVHRFVKDLVGPEQWDGDDKTPGLKALPIRKLSELVKVWGDESKTAGNS